MAVTVRPLMAMWRLGWEGQSSGVTAHDPLGSLTRDIAD